MRVEFNKVTQFSRILAIVIMVGLPFWGFYVGYEYGSVQTPPPAGYTLTNAAPVMSYRTASGSVAYAPFEPKTYQTSFYSKGDGPRYAYSFSYPRDFDLATGDQASAGSFMQGAAQVSVRTPSDAFRNPKTNFGDASFNVSVASGAQAAADCYTMPVGGRGIPAPTSTAVINGLSFVTAATTDAGAGNYYDSRVYRTVFNGFCFEAALTVHTGNIGAYPPGTVAPFDENQAFGILGTILNSFEISTSTIQ